MKKYYWEARLCKAIVCEKLRLKLFNMNQKYYTEYVMKDGRKFKLIDYLRLPISGKVVLIEFDDETFTGYFITSRDGEFDNIMSNSMDWIEFRDAREAYLLLVNWLKTL